MSIAEFRLLSVTDAAAALGLPTWRLYQLVEQRAIPHHRIGRRVLFTRDDLAAALNALAVPVARSSEETG